jgi:outer membrane lipoprotein-sorting protein
MNCAEYQGLLVAYLEGLLTDSQKQAVEEHVKQCETCRTELEGLQTLQQRLVGNGKALAQSDLEEQVMNRIIREQSARLKSAGQAGMGLRLRRLIMKSGIVKLAVAAAVILAAAGGIFLWTSTKSGVALADVLAKMEQVQAFIYHMDNHMKMTGPGAAPAEVDVKMTWLIADGYGMRMDASVPDPATGQMVEEQTYLLPEQKVMLTLTPAKKQYERMMLDDVALQKQKDESSDPRRLIREMLAAPCKDLGKTVLDGVEVQGFRTADPAFTGGLRNSDTTLWVDVKTWLPVRMDVKLKVNEQMEMRISQYGYQWDVPLSAAQFHPVIPPDFTAGVADGMKIPAMTEQGAIEGLQFCIEFLGKYPESLDPGEMMKMFQSLQANPTPAMKKLMQEAAQSKSVEEGTARTMKAITPLQSLMMFHMSLVAQKKEPVYYGKIAQPGDIAQILLRWKTGENEYRVIFADLHAATVDADTLAKLEAGLPK